MSGLIDSITCCVERVLNQETRVLVCGAGVEASSFVEAWGCAVGAHRDLTESNGVLIRRPAIGMLDAMPLNAAVRLCAADISSVVRGEEHWKPVAALGKTGALPQRPAARAVLLVDLKRFEQPSACDKVLLCWAWKHAFPDIPEAIVRMMAEGALSPGKLRDERQLLRPLLSALSDGHRENFLLSIVLCNGDELHSSEACAEARQHLRRASEDAAAAIQAEAAAQNGFAFLGSPPRVHIVDAPDLTPMATRSPLTRSLAPTVILDSAPEGGAVFRSGHPPMRIFFGQLIFFQELSYLFTTSSRHTSPLPLFGPRAAELLGVQPRRVWHPPILS